MNSKYLKELDSSDMKVSEESSVKEAENVFESRSLMALHTKAFHFLCVGNEEPEWFSWDERHTLTQV